MSSNLQLPHIQRWPTAPHQPTSFPHPAHPHFNPAELATLKVLGLDPEILTDVIKEGLRADLFTQIARNAALLSQIPTHERTEALIDLWLFKVDQQVKDEIMMRSIQDQGTGGFTLSDRGIADALARWTELGRRYRIRGDGDDLVVGVLASELAVAYRDALALVDMDSLSERFTRRGPNGVYVSLNRTLSNRFTREWFTSLTPRRYGFIGSADLCGRVPPIDSWPAQIIEAFSVGDWQFGLKDGHVVLLVAEGWEARLVTWLTE